MPTKPESKEKEEELKELNSDVCNVVESLDVIGSKWKLIILHSLNDGEKRFNQLKRSTGASSYTLSRVLDSLQEDGLVEKRIEEDAPIATYYSLSEMGQDLCPVFDALDEWGEKWL
ncbi:MAG: helix-turn-helix domain-containing protein [Halobacteria archaeon]|nr:helix-turn-helix domain-containing protein [Halobacteria archaeon]